MPQEEILLTTDEVEVRYKITKQTQALRRKSGEWVYIKDGRRYKYYKVDIDAWVKKQAVRNSNEL